MPRVPITEAALGVDADKFVKALDGASVQVNVHGGSAATVYAADVGGTTLSNPVTADNGRIPGWVEEGTYDLVVTYDGDTADPVVFNARAAYPSGGTEGAVLTYSSSGVSWTAPTAITAGLPWTIDINGLLPPATQTNWDTLNINQPDQPMNGYVSSDGTQNDEIGWDVVLAAGDWNLYVLAANNSDQGIITASLDGASVGTIDQYAATLTYNVTQSITGITVASTGKKRLLFKMGAKNGSSSSYIGRVTAVRLRRTA